MTQQQLPQTVNDLLAILYREGCLFCGEKDARCLRFHPSMRPADEPLDLGRIAAMTFEQARKKLAQCLVLCCNCHAKVLAERCCSTCGREFTAGDDIVQYFVVADGGQRWMIDGFYHDTPTCDRWRGNRRWRREDAPPWYTRRRFRTKP